MLRFAQGLAAVFVLILAMAGINTLLNPMFVAEPSGFNPVDNYGLTNIRTLGAPTLSLAIITAIGAYRKEWLLILPAALYYFFNLTARIISVIVEGYEPVMLRGLLLTSVLVILSQLAIQLFRRAQASSSSA